MVTKLYKWDFDKTPWDSRTDAKTFSVGIYQWLPTSRGDGVKKSKTIRVLGYVTAPDAVYAKACELCRKLNAAGARIDKPPGWLQKQYSLPKPVGLTAKAPSERERPTAKQRVARMMRNTLAPKLKPRGFRLARKTFWRDNGSQCQIISLRMSSFGTSRSGSFYIELGVLWHDVDRVLTGRSRKRLPPPEYECTFRYDLGCLSRGLQRSWDVDCRTNLAELGDVVLRDIVKYGLPWLEYRCDPRRVLRRYVPEGPVNDTAELTEMACWSWAVFLAQRGRINESKDELRSWQSAGENPRRVAAIARRLHIDL